MRDLVVEWWPVLVAFSAGTVFGFVLCAVLSSGRVEDAVMEAEARMDHARFLKEEAVRDAADLTEDHDLEPEIRRCGWRDQESVKEALREADLTITCKRWLPGDAS